MSRYRWGLRGEAGRQGITRGVIARAARGADPACFAMVMATGIVSAALRQAGLPRLSAALLAVAAASFVILAAASCWRAAAYPADLRADLTCPDRAFASFAFVAACGVLGNGLAAGQPDAAAALAAAALAAWLTLTCLIPARLAARPSARPPVSTVNGTRYLWPVATQSLAIAAAFVQAGGHLPAELAAAAGIAAWSAGVTLYLVVMVLVVTRLLLAGLGPAEAMAPYWVAMGAASISAFAAARILHSDGAAVVAAARAVITSVAVALWAVATGLIPVLATLTARFLRPPARPRYRPQAWAIVFPLGMYAVAGLQLGTAARLPLIHHIGAAAVWPAAAAWAVTFTAMAASPFTRRRRSAHPKATGRAPAGRPSPRNSTPRSVRTVAEMKRYKYQALVTLLPPHDGGLQAPLPGPTCRMVVRARHRATGASKIFSALVTTSDDSPRPGTFHLIVTLVVLGDDAGDYLAPGEQFALWRGHDVGRGIVTRRIFV